MRAGTPAGELLDFHVVLAFAQVEWDTFCQGMRNLDVNPHEMLQALEEQLQTVPVLSGSELRVAPATKLVFKLATERASRAGHQMIESSDLFSALFDQTAPRVVDPATRAAQTAVSPHEPSTPDEAAYSAVRHAVRASWLGRAHPALANLMAALLATALVQLPSWIQTSEDDSPRRCVTVIQGTIEQPHVLVVCEGTPQWMV